MNHVLWRRSQGLRLGLKAWPMDNDVMFQSLKDNYVFDSLLISSMLVLCMSGNVPVYSRTLHPYPLFGLLRPTTLVFAYMHSNMHFVDPIIIKNFKINYDMGTKRNILNVRTW